MHPKKLLVGIGIALSLLLAAVFMLPLLVDKAAVKGEITAAFKQATGLDLQIQGEPSIHVFPLPHITIDDLYVSNTPVAATSFLVAIKSLDLHLSPLSVFSAHPVPSRVDVYGPDVELERLGSGEMNWRERARQASSGGTYSAAPASVLALPEMTISGGVVHFTDASIGMKSEYRDIQATFTTGGPQGQDTAVAAKLRVAGMPLAIHGHFGTLLSGVAPASLQIDSGKSFLAYEGRAGVRDGNAYMKGNVNLSMEDIAPWVAAMLNDAKRDAAKQYAKLPLQAKGEMELQGGTLTLPDLSLSGPVIKGNLQGALTGLSRLEITASLARFDLETAAASRLADMQAEPAIAPVASDIPGMSPAPVKTFLDTIALAADVQIADALYNGQHIEDSHIAFTYSGGDMAISQANAKLPGNSRVVFTGIGREGAQGFDLEGQIDAAGNDFYAMMKVFKPKGFALPPQDFKRFRVKTNAVISAQEVQLSELAARIENMGFVGGIVTSFAGARPLVKAALRIGGVDLDHFVTLWGLEEWRASFLNESLAPKKEGLLSQWLSLLGYDVQLSASLEKYILGGKPYDKSAFRLSAGQGRISFDHLSALYNGARLDGSMSLSVQQSPPRIDLNFSADNVDLPVFLGSPPAQGEQEAASGPQRWSHKGFDFHWLELMNGSYRLHCDHFKNGLLQMDDAEMNGSVDAGSLKVDSLTADVMGGHISGKSMLTGSRIPSLTVEGQVVGVDAQQLAKALPGLEGMSGKYNLDVHLATSGIDTFSWASNLEGAIGMAARGIVIHDFDLPGIIQAFAYVRTTADILDAVRHAFPGGQTVFTGATGQWEAKNGVLRTTRLRLGNARAFGLYSGEADIVNWKTRGQITFELKSLDALHPPSVALQIVGDLNAPQKTLDTHLLEQYVAGKTSQQMLNQYGH